MYSSDPIEQAASQIAAADALLFTAGAGMGVDSGLPDFRGPEGFWRAYPAYGALGLSFSGLADPRWFRMDPQLAWGFYGHRLGLYRSAVPHDGYAVLNRLAARARHAAFVFTSNVDGQFQRAGAEAARIVECHGSIHHAQCMVDCGVGIFAADGFEVTVDPTTFRAELPLPTCPRCGALARPNIQMFGDPWWDDARTQDQAARLLVWLNEVNSAGAQVAVIECGAGTAIPTVRSFSGRRYGSATSLIRINRHAHHVPAGQIGIAMGAREALLAIEAQLHARVRPKRP